MKQSFLFNYSDEKLKYSFILSIRFNLIHQLYIRSEMKINKVFYLDKCFLILLS